MSLHGRRFQDPKLTTILHDDFSNYTQHITEEMRTADACIYCLGTNIPVKPAELNRKINFDYALATARNFAEASKPNQSPVRFVYLSGALTEKDQGKHLWFLEDNRKMRGELENALLELEKGLDHMSISIARPGFVQPPGAHLRTWVIGKVANAILQDDLAVAMVQLALEGCQDSLVENVQLKAIAKGGEGGKNNR
ncbi:hypothetical protein LSUE1_G006343 [Lachnellula suecica]|uniref:NAD(P)-binding domain-containing protein n=1 Tax=Lachnellula suecica TaxID=602035 RepID=A0A8T9BYG5_9HELO|nr:hypothetical protein LSUE1_G006343 [Lachnellula suecica]